MKKLIVICYLLIGCSVTLLAEPGIRSGKDGLHIAENPVTKLSFFHGTTPVVQRPNTETARAVLQAYGLQASGGSEGYVTPATNPLQHIQVSLSAANLIAMYATPVQIIAAQGAGKSIVVAKLTFRITRTSTAFTGGGAVIFQYANTANGAGTQSLDSTLASTVITGAAGTTDSFRNGAVVSDAASTVTENVGLFISNATAAFAAGTGTATVDVEYYVY